MGNKSFIPSPGSEILGDVANITSTAVFFKVKKKKSISASCERNSLMEDTDTHVYFYTVSYMLQ